jgi:ElaB/YqjD/DUF883 family membrane-anchored ribosome-binding protein
VYWSGSTLQIDRPPNEILNQWELFLLRHVVNHVALRQEIGTNQMTNTERSTHPPSSNAYRSSGSVHTADGATDDLATKGAAAFREVKASVESVIADAGDKGQQAWDYAGKKGQEAVDNVREVRDTLAVAIERSVTKRPYTTLALAVAAGFLFGAIWRR